MPARFRPGGVAADASATRSQPTGIRSPAPTTTAGSRSAPPSRRRLPDAWNQRRACAGSALLACSHSPPEASARQLTIDRSCPCLAQRSRGSPEGVAGSNTAPPGKQGRPCRLPSLEIRHNRALGACRFLANAPLEAVVGTSRRLVPNAEPNTDSATTSSLLLLPRSRSLGGLQLAIPGCRIGTNPSTSPASTSPPPQMLGFVPEEQPDECGIRLAGPSPFPNCSSGLQS